MANPLASSVFRIQAENISDCSFQVFAFSLQKIQRVPDNNAILADLKSHLKRNFDKRVREVILFGSQARGEAGENSDYDVLIVVEDDYTGTDENHVLDLCYDIDLKYNILLDVHLLSVRELGTIRGRQPIFVNALKSGLHA